MKVVSVVVPVYRNASTLEILYSQVVDVFNRLQGIEFELCFVDDGSDDESFEFILKLATQDDRVSYLSFDRNYGQVAAIIAGLRHCKGNSAVVMSADLQDPPEMILEMVRSWEGGSVITICNRKSRNDRFIDAFFSAIFYGTMKLIYPLIPKGGFDFFLLDRSALLLFNAINKSGRFIQGDVIKLKLPIVFLPYERLARKAGKSQWTLKRKLLYAFDAFFYEDRVICLFVMFVFLLGFILMSGYNFVIDYLIFLTLIIVVSAVYCKFRSFRKKNKENFYYRIERHS
jgi:glycosyltransferase involved in cell wall biosynthesis